MAAEHYTPPHQARHPPVTAAIDHSRMTAPHQLDNRPAALSPIPLLDSAIYLLLRRRSAPAIDLMQREWPPCLAANTFHGANLLPRPA